MLSVTDSAKEKLREALENEKVDDGTFVQIATSFSTPGGIGFVLDKGKKRDKMIKDGDGDKFFLLGSDIHTVLTGMILDYNNLRNEEMQFTIMEL
ncbi:MAG: hypothetical protein JW932_16310 [Deltaproteobacteria bacterium]|nr:hypothetical protein [Deltaproteobacteria bacterium]